MRGRRRNFRNPPHIFQIREIFIDNEFEFFEDSKAFPHLLLRQHCFGIAAKRLRADREKSKPPFATIKLRSKTMKTKSRSLEANTLSRLNHYTALAGTGLAASSAHGAIVLWDSSNWILNGSNSAVVSGDYGTARIYFDFENGQVANSNFTGADFAAGVKKSTTSSASCSSAFVNQLNGAILLSNKHPAKLGSDADIDSNQTWGTDRLLYDKGNHSGNWKFNEQTGYLGLKFQLDDGTDHYGWANITLNNHTPRITLNRFAYNTVGGEGILAGQTPVPEPDTALPMALLVLGSAGMGRYRRRSRASKK
jgi:hypothetical protein